MQTRTLKVVHLVIPFVVVALSALGVHLATRARFDHNGPAGAGVTKFVDAGKDYYVFVRLVETAATDEQGKAWDSTNESAPDLRVDIEWRGQRVYRSSVRQDSLIAKWSNAELDLQQIALNGGTASLESVLQAARISIVAGEALTISVFDQDLPMGDGELAGRFAVQTSSLQLGEQTLVNPTPALKRVVLLTSSLDAPPQIQP